MDTHTKVKAEQKRIKAKIKNSTKEDLVLELIKVRAANAELQQALEQREREINDLQMLVRTYQTGVQKKVLEGLVAIEL